MKFCVFFYHVARTLGTRHDSWWMIMSVRSGIFLSWPTTAVVSYYCHGNQTYDHYTDHASSGVTPSSLRDCSRGVSEHATECDWCDHNQSHSCDIERRIIQQNLSAGDRITIVYEHYRPPKQGWAGPRSIPILKRGETTFAFIAFDFEEKAYVPAAKGASFEMPIPLRWETQSKRKHQR